MENDDYFDAVSYRDNQRAAIRKTIREIGIDELKSIGESIFPIVTDPWCERYFQFLAEHKDCRFYHAESNSGVRVIYCRQTDQGLWFLPGKGMGVVMPKGIKVLQEVVADL